MITGIGESSNSRVGIISDTHGLLRPEAVEQLLGCSLILHAGDIGNPAVIRDLEKLAPVYPIRGNVDRGEWAACYPFTRLVEFAGKRIFLVHNLDDLGVDLVTMGYDLVVTGHSHRPRILEKDGVLYVNPGSAGPRRFKLPIAVAVVQLDAGTMTAELRYLDV